MSEMMYVVQLEIYFRRGTTVEQAEKAIKPLADVCPFPIRVERSSQEEASVRELEFVDNIGGFDPKEFQNVVRKVLEKDATATNSISLTNRLGTNLLQHGTDKKFVVNTANILFSIFYLVIVSLVV